MGDLIEEPGAASVVRDMHGRSWTHRGDSDKRGLPVWECTGLRDRRAWPEVRRHAPLEAVVVFRHSADR